jgi:uncharacterized protein YdhG (YjbR/CyaY superfamily)
VKTSSTAPSTIDQYIRGFAPHVRSRLSKLRETIRQAAPDATEKISYGMPTFHLNGNLVHFAGFEHHIGFYPTPSAITKFKTRLKDYKSSKGAVQFAHDEELPLDLVAEITKFRVEESSAPKTKGSKK